MITTTLQDRQHIGRMIRLEQLFRKARKNPILAAAFQREKQRAYDAARQQGRYVEAREINTVFAD